MPDEFFNAETINNAAKRVIDYLRQKRNSYVFIQLICFEVLFRVTNRDSAMFTELTRVYQKHFKMKETTDEEKRQMQQKASTLQ